MCCFSRPVKYVSSTSIFARRSAPSRQVLAYSMSLEATEELAMILPLPVPPGSPEDAVRFLDLSGYPSFFKDLDAAFRVEEQAVSDGFAPQGPSRHAPPLAVHEVGDFVASFVPRIADFSRLDSRFRLDDAVWKKLPRYGDYGFAVFQLKGFGGGWWARLTRKASQKNFHPMAFDFPTRAPEHLFFPTVHVHDGEVHPAARFDHSLYAQAPRERLVGCASEPGGAEQTAWQRGASAHQHLRTEASRGVVVAEDALFKLVLTGEQTNADRWVDLSA